MGTYVNTNRHGIRLIVAGNRYRFGRGQVIVATGALADALEATSGVRVAEAGERGSSAAYVPPEASEGVTTTQDVDALAALLGVEKQGLVRDGEGTAEQASVGPTGGGETNAPDPSIAAAGPTQATTEAVRSDGDAWPEPDEKPHEVGADEAAEITRLTSLYEREPWRAVDLDEYTIAELRAYAAEHEDVVGKVPSDVTRRDDIQQYIETQRTKEA